MTNEQIDRGIKMLKAESAVRDYPIHHNQLIGLLQAMKEPEEKNFNKNNTPYGEICMKCIANGDVDHICEVYDKWKDNKDNTSIQDYAGFINDMWNAIKQYCEAL